MTAKRRTDLVDARAWDAPERDILARAGWVIDSTGRSALTVRLAKPEESSAVSELARRLFRLAHPAGLPQEAIAAFTQAHLDREAFADAIADRDVLVAQVGDSLVGYALIAAAPIPFPVTKKTVEPTRCAYVSKLYVEQAWHGSGVAGALLEAALRQACERWPDIGWVALRVNDANDRALTFYRRRGFRKAGRRFFDVGGKQRQYFLLVRDLTAYPPQPDLTRAPAAWNNGPGV